MIRTMAIACPNEDCKEYVLSCSIHDYRTEYRGEYGTWEVQDAKKTWKLIPQSSAKVFPDYVPAALTADYQEACSIRELSPKASATLSRRCLQGMIRDFWGVKGKRTLYDEIQEIQDKVDPATWEAIDAVRGIGNIGAHMEQDINLVVDVDPEEANLLIELIETLLNDWYIVREERAKRMAAIVGVSAEKKEAKKPIEE